MSTLLLVVIYIAFIGLGLPDSLFGTAWPAVYAEFSLPVSMGGVYAVLACAGTIASSLCSARLVNRLGTGRIVAYSTALTVVGLLCNAVAPGYWWMCLTSIPLGFGAGAVDAALNDYVALHYTASQMSFLHCFYGVGVSLSPYLMSLALADDAAWRDGYRLAFFCQIVIMAVTFIALPLWKRMQKEHQAAHPNEEPPRTLTLLEMARMPAVRTVWIIFTTSCAIEFTCGQWGSTFLVEAKGLALDAAARMVMLFYVGMALGRFLSGVLGKRFTSWQLIQMSQGLMLLALLFLLLPFGTFFAAVGLFLIGLGTGPLFPNMTHLTPQNFGRDVSQAVIGSQMAFSNFGIMVFPPLFGLLAQLIGEWLFPWYVLVLFAVMVASTLSLIRQMKQQGRY